MGVDTKRFISPLPQDFICPICNDVFDAPVQCKDEHIFCNDCILKWMLKINRCPLDQQSLCCTELTPAPRVFRNMLDNLELRCEFSEHGCHTITTLESMEVHVTNCKFRSVMERRAEELRLLQEQVQELIDDIATIGNNTKLLNENLIETNEKLATATAAIDDLQVQVDDKNCKLAQLQVELGNKDSKLVQLESKFERLQRINNVKSNRTSLELTKIQNLIGALADTQQLVMNRESAHASRTKQIAGITQEISASLTKLTNKLNEIEMK